MAKKKISTSYDDDRKERDKKMTKSMKERMKENEDIYKGIKKLHKEGIKRVFY